jgi:predicted AlkP superfamily pyrophosphatase or phosphodiesterase
MFASFRLRILIAAAWLWALVALANPHAEHVFIISLDGGKPAVIQKSEMPVLGKILAEGAHTWNAKTIFPSKTLPSHTSMLTGVGPDKHKVLWNDWIPAKGLVRVPSVFTEAKAADLSTAMFVGKAKFRHFLVPGMVDEFSYNQDHSAEVSKVVAGQTKTMKEGTVLAKFVAQDAARYIVEKKPNLCFIHFTDADDFGHKYGWGSKQQMKAFAEMDSALGEIFEAIHRAGIAQSSVVIISADHGGHAKTHGLNTPDDKTIPWIVWGEHVKKGFTIQAPVVTYDTAATALWLLGAPHPKDMDGFPVESAFE